MTEQKQQTTSAISDELESFLRAYKDRDGNYKYFDRINNMMASNTTFIVVDYIDLDRNKPELTKLITDTPDDMFDAFNKAVYSILREIHYDYAEEIKDKIKVRIGNYSVQKGLREINADVINKLISVPGMVVRTSEIKPLAKKIAYACLNCNTLNEAQLKGLTLKKPMRCTQCSEKELEMDPEHSYFTDFQLVRIQELPEDLPAGQLPHYVEVTVMDDLVDRCRPGDRVLLTGIVRIEQEQSLQVRTSLFRLRMEGNNIEFLGGILGNKDERTVDSKDERTVDRIVISREDEKRILALASMPDNYDKLIASFAPHIYGHEVIKESILLLIVGSVTKKLADGSNRRGDINIFLVGDPGTAKSEMLKFAAKIAPRGLYTSGRGTTAAGLTAAVIRDKSGIMMLEAGAVVLGDQGLVCMTEDTEIYTGNRLVPVGKLWDDMKGEVYITKSGREAKKALIPIGIYDNKYRVDMEGNAFALMRKKHTGDVIKLTFSSGLTLKVTPEHLLRRSTHVKNLWVQAQDVCPGDMLRSPVRVQKPSCTLNITEEDAYVIGCIYGDGYVTPQSITISQSKVNSDVITNIQQKSDVFSLYDKGDRIRTLGKYVLVSRMFQLYTADKTLLKKTRFLIKDQSIDNALLLSDKSLWAFLAGVFDTDGDFNHVHDKVVAARMYPSTSQHELAVILYVLRRLGVYAKLRKTRKGFPLIHITGSDITRFADGIKSYSIKSKREGPIKIDHKSSIQRGVEKVVLVERIPYDGYVYDLSVGKYHNYEASLIYIHNCIDEFDKIKSEDRSALHEVMEQQTCSVAKGGIVATLNARTSILSAANPKYGKYDPFRNITENVEPLPIPLLTRFDIIHVIRDSADTERDNRIASHILEIHRDIEHAAQSAIEIDLFRKYLAYAKQIEPKLTPEAIDILRKYYLQMRNVDSEGMITATPRQLEGLVRLATARARLLLKDSVDTEDAERAIYLVSQMLETVGIDVNTGKVDLGVLHGKPLSETSKLKTFTDVFNGLSGEDKNDVEEKNFIDELVKTGKFTEDEAKDFIRKAMQNGQIYERRAGFYAKA